MQANITSKGALLLFTLLTFCKQYTEFFDHSTVILERVSGQNLIIIFFVRLNNNRYIFCYFILNHDYNCIFVLCVSFISFIIIYLEIFESVICCHFCHNFFGAVKELHKVPFPIMMYTSIGTYIITVTYYQLLPESGAITDIIIEEWNIY